MINLKSTDIPDLQQYRTNISADGAKIFVDSNTMADLADDFNARHLSALYILQMYLSVFSEGHHRSFTPEALIDTLISYCGCTRDQFRYMDKVDSLDMTHVVKPLIDSLTVRVSNTAYKGIQLFNALTLLKAYQRYKELYTRKTQIASKINRTVLTDEVSWTNAKLSTVAFKYRQADTGRYYTYDDSIQNWPLELTKSITTPKGYFLFWCDFDQIDFRVGYHLYLREIGSESDKIYLSRDDKYQAMYEIICKAANKTPDLELFKTYRKSYKKAILSAMYNASENSLIEDIDNRELGHELYEYFKNNHKYQTFRRKITKLIDFGVDAVMKDYFGFERSIPMPNLSNPREVNDAISKCCNTPIQSTSNSIMVLWLEKTLQMFEKHGFSRETDVIPYLIRHDECIFMVSCKALNYLYLFKNAMSVSVDDWDIITLEPHLGYSYKDPNDRLESLFEQQCLEHVSEITVVPTNCKREKVYRPVQEVVEVYAYDTTPATTRATAMYNPDTDDIPEELLESKGTWTEDQALAVLNLLVEQHPEYTELKTYLKHYGVYLIYSQKLNKYKLIPDLTAAMGVANNIETNKITVYNTVQTASMLVQGVMFKIVASHAAQVKSLFQNVDRATLPQDWFNQTELIGDSNE